MEYDDFTEAFIGSLTHLMDAGNTIAVRGMETKELTSQTITVRNPLRRIYSIPHRNDNIFAKIAETLWMLAGRDDIEWLSYYLPRAPQFSDNGKTWRGAYGPRLRNWNGADDRADQLANVVSLLRRDPATRQAVISIWDPSEDLKPTLDVPCNNWMQFIIRDANPDPGDDFGDWWEHPWKFATKKVIHMNVAQRSSDLMWGYSGIDTFSWSVLHQMMAFWTGTDVGTFTHFIGSLHIYSNHWERVGKILEDYNGQSVYTLPGVDTLSFSTPFQRLDDEIKHTLTADQIAFQDDEFLAECQRMLYMYHLYKDKPEGWSDNLLASIHDMPMCDFRVAAVEYFQRDPDLKRLLDVSDVSDVS